MMLNFTVLDIPIFVKEQLQGKWTKAIEPDDNVRIVGAGISLVNMKDIAETR